MSDTVKAPQTARPLPPKPVERPFEFDDFRVIHQADIMRGEVMAKLFVRVAAAVKAFFLRAVRAVEQAQTMRALASLDDRALADIGLKRGDIPALCIGDAKPAAVPRENVEIEARRAA